MLILTPKSYKHLKTCPAQYRFDRVDRIKGHQYVPTLKQFQLSVIKESLGHIINTINLELPVFADEIFQKELEYQKGQNPHLNFKDLNMNGFYLDYRHTVKFFQGLKFFGRNKAFAKMPLGEFSKPIIIGGTEIGLVGILDLVYKTEKEVHIIDLRIQESPLFDSEVLYLYALMLKLNFGLSQPIICNSIIVGKEDVQSYPFTLDKELYIIYRLKTFKALIDSGEFEFHPSEAACDFCSFRGHCVNAYVPVDIDPNQTYFKY